jgi:hypothetical protein
MENQPTQRAFWTKPEGITGILTILGIVAAGAFALLTFGPALLAALSMAIALTSKLIVLGALCTVAFLGFLVVTNKRVHTLVSYFFKSAMRKVTQAFVEIDPIGIMRSFVSDLRERKNVMAENIRKLNGQKTTVEEKVRENKRQAEEALKMAQVAKNKGNSALMTVNSKQHGRLTEYTVRLEDVLAKMELLLKMLRKYYEAADAVISDLTNEVNIQEDQRKMMFAAHNAMTAAREIIAGEGDKRELFDLAMESVKDSYGQKLGEIEDFMQMSQSFIDGMDLKNGVFEADALKKIADWEANVDSLLLGDSKRQILESHGTQAIPVFNANTLGAGTSDYSKLFNGSR